MPTPSLLLSGLPHHCPRCVRPPLERCQYEGHSLEICPRCAGLWCTPSHWSADELGPFPAMDAGPADQAAPAADGPLEPHVTPGGGLTCPNCHEAMTTLRAGGEEGVELDQCPSCGGVWFDRDEWDELATLRAWRQEQQVIARPTTWGQWCFQFFLGLPVEFNLPPRRFPFVTVGLVALCTVVYLVQLIAGDEVWGPFATRPNLLWHGAGVYTLVTSDFLHAGWLHLLGNMYFLYILGDNVEDALGHWTYLFFYLTCGAAADLLHAAVFATSTTPLVGASGAICGVMAAYVVLYPRARLTFMLFFWQFKLSVVWWMVIYFGIQIVAAALAVGKPDTAQVAYFGHIGGFLCGFALVWPLRGLIVQRNPWLRVLHTWKELPAAKRG